MFNPFLVKKMTIVSVRIEIFYKQLLIVNFCNDHNHCRSCLYFTNQYFAYDCLTQYYNHLRLFEIPKLLGSSSLSLLHPRV